MKTPWPKRRWLLASLAAASLLAACGGGVDSDDDDDHDHDDIAVDTAGRLAIAELNAANSSTGALLARRDLGDTPSAMAWLGITR